MGVDENGVDFFYQVQTLPNIMEEFLPVNQTSSISIPKDS